jgi:hypothetical protein
MARLPATLLLPLLCWTPCCAACNATTRAILLAAITIPLCMSCSSCTCQLALLSCQQDSAPPWGLDASTQST